MYTFFSYWYIPIMSSRLPIKVISATRRVNTGTLIFLHGSGDCGSDLYDWIKHTAPDFKFPHLKMLFPTALENPYTPLGGELSNVWFDRLAISKQVPEDIESINLAATDIVNIVHNETQSGIPLERIVVGGFSMGGALAFHVGFRYLTELAGIFALSSFINDNSVLYTNLKKNQGSKPSLFQWHGVRDDLVPIQWGKETFQALHDLGIEGNFYEHPHALHELKKDALLKLKSWIIERVPEP